MSTPPYSPEFLADIGRTISQARLSRYMLAAGGDVQADLALYEKNIAVSEALSGFLHGLEVSVRNSMHYVRPSTGHSRDGAGSSQIGSLLPHENTEPEVGQSSAPGKYA